MKKNRTKKQINYFKVISIALIIYLIIVNVYQINTSQKKIEELSSENLKLSSKNAELSSENLQLSELKQGMKVTMLGGANLKSDRNVNSCGYIVRTKEDMLIIVDGGVDTDADLVKSYIDKYGNGKVDFWFVTHPHSDHVGALIEILNDDSNIEIDNLCYSFNSKEWYEENDERGWKSEEKMFSALESEKIKNKIECEKGQVIDIDNIRCDILRIANPEITNSDNGNDSSMVFKFTATDVNLSMIFLGDAYYYASIELLENSEELKADAVQMAHHGQNGVSKEVYEAISPELCFFSAPEWLYNNDNGTGYNTGTWQSVVVRGWVEELGAKQIMAFNGDRTIWFTKNGIEY